MKKAKYIAFISLVVSLGATACGPQNPASPSNPPSPSGDWSGKTNEDFSKGKTTYTSGGVEKPLTMNSIYTNSNTPHLDSVGNGNVLVVPFGFTDTNLQEVQTEANINRIETTFFGEEGAVDSEGWMSVKTFYDKSSYGKTEFKGQVVPTWVNCGQTAAEFASGTAGINAAEFARNWYVTEYNKTGHGELGENAKPLTYFDQNNDGFIDLIWIVYSHPIDQEGGFWAYKTNTSNSADYSKPAVKVLAWASIGFMNNGFGGYDPHTFIHETGHTYGLDDYYDYNNEWKPMGGIDYMDQNLGDHAMFSKFTLGWVNPWVVDDDAIITLRPGTTTGDCFIIPSPNYNGTAFDEYMMFELMAPVGLAEHDYMNGYSGTNGYTKPGIRITHVDARLNKGTFDDTSTTNPENGRDFRVCNTKRGRTGVGVDSDYWPLEVDGKTEDRYYTLTSLMESDYSQEENWTTRSSYLASYRTLFRKNHYFDLKPTAGGWAETFMPSKSNLWNKAKQNEERSGKIISEISVDTSCTFNYSVEVLSIEEDPTYDYVAQVRVYANDY